MAMLFVDPSDPESQRIRDLLDRYEVSYKITELGPKTQGCGIKVAFAGAPDTFTEFASRLTPPILVVQHHYNNRSLDIAVFEGEIPIKVGLHIG